MLYAEKFCFIKPSKFMHKILRWRPVKAHTLTPATGRAGLATDLPPPLCRAPGTADMAEAGAQTRHGPRVGSQERRQPGQ